MLVHVLVRPSVEERFWAKVDRDGECWIWLGAHTRDGYGLFSPVGRHPRVNPTHLFLGTPADNMADMVRKGRQAKGAGMIGRAKINDAIVIRMRELRCMGLQPDEIARRFFVSSSTVKRMLRGESWRHVPWF